jgi:Skp family chaperone for outer membrane proteins
MNALYVVVPFLTVLIFAILFLAKQMAQLKAGLVLSSEAIQLKISDALAVPEDGTGEEIVDLKQKIDEIKRTKRRLSDDLEDLKGKHKREKMEMEFLISKQEEKNEIDQERMEVSVEKRTATMEKDLQKKYYEKTEKLLEKFQDKMDAMLKEIMGLVPKVSASLEVYNENTHKK